MNAYLEALLLTWVIEIPCYVLALPHRVPGLRRGALIDALVVNLVSHPPAFLAVYPVLAHGMHDAAALAAVELAVVFGEAALLGRSWGGRALPASAVANLGSLVAGVMLFG